MDQKIELFAFKTLKLPAKMLKAFKLSTLNEMLFEVVKGRSTFPLVLGRPTRQATGWTR